MRRVRKSTTPANRLALDGGSPARTQPEPPMYPGAVGVGEDELAAVQRVIESRSLYRYQRFGDAESEAAAYETEWADRFGVEYALAVSSGSSALLCGLVACGIGPGDEVIVPAYTWTATPNAVVQLGAVPVLAEVDESLTLDVADVERRLGPRTRAIMPVHMRGAPCDMEALMEIARAHGLAVIEDACQAIGASYHGQKLGVIGDVGAYSTQQNKLITTGEGGMLVTHEEEYYLRALDAHDAAGYWRVTGQLPRYPSFNFRCSELQAAVGRVQLARLPELLRHARRAHARLCARVEGLPGLTLRPVNDVAGDACIALIAFARTATLADEACHALRAEGVTAFQLYRPSEIDLHVWCYWKPVLNRIHEAGNPAPDCRRTLGLLERAIHIDTSPQLEDEDVDEIGAALEKVAVAVLR